MRAAEMDGAKGIRVRPLLARRSAGIRPSLTAPRCSVAVTTNPASTRAQSDISPTKLRGGSGNNFISVGAATRL